MDRGEELTPGPLLGVVHKELGDGGQGGVLFDSYGDVPDDGPNGMVSLGDGESELVLVRDPGSLDGLSEIISSAITQKYDSENLLILHTKSAKFSFDKPVAWTRDGEAGGEYQELTLTNHKAAVKLIF